MGNEIYQVCSCKDSIENPIKEKVSIYNIYIVNSAYQMIQQEQTL